MQGYVKTTAAVMVASAGLALGLTAIAPDAAAAQRYGNCKALNADYPHGVGKPGAVDSTSKTPVTTFTVDADLYQANASKLDRDDDGIACEKA